MQSTPKYLEIIKSRGERRVELKRVYRNIQNEQLFLRAYSNIYDNKGATTKGVDTEDTVDGMSIKKIKDIIDKLKNGNYKWKPAKRIYIPKTTGKRPLSIPGWKDKLLQKVIEIVLSSYYEPQFYDNSHGFRPGKSCHTALTDIVNTWQGVKWFIEGDIRSCFDHIKHDKLLEIITEQIKDNRLLKLLKEMMKAGYIENWKYEKTFSGVPQGGILSPLLSNIYLNELDKFVNEELIPEYNRGKRRKHNPEYIALTQKIRKAKDTKNFELQKLLKKKRNKLPSKDTQDKNYRRLKYVRYADDFLLGFIGPIAEAQVIKEKIRKFLQEKLGLELSENKTLITHAVENKARFLGYDVSIALCNSKKSHNGRSINGNPILQVPPEITTKWKRKVCKNGKPIHRTELMHDCDYDIVSIYNAEFQGLVNYYLMAQNVAREMYKLKYVYTQSLVKTIAAKHKKNSRWVYRKYSKKFPLGIKGLEVKVDRTDGKPLLARFGSRPIKRQKMVRTKDEITIIKTNRNEILRKLLNDVCEMCGHQGNIEMHHIRKLKDLKKRYRGRKQPPEWVKKMIALNRKTIPVCKDCHRKIHNGTLC